MRYSSMKELHVEVKRLVHLGWMYQAGGKHGKLRHPSGYPMVVFARSPSDWRTVANFKREVRVAEFRAVGRRGETDKDVHGNPRESGNPGFLAQCNAPRKRISEYRSMDVRASWVQRTLGDLKFLQIQPSP